MPKFSLARKCKKNSKTAALSWHWTSRRVRPSTLELTRQRLLNQYITCGQDQSTRRMAQHRQQIVVLISAVQLRVEQCHCEFELETKRVSDNILGHSQR